MAATLAAYYKQIDVGHVEAGLRTHNIYSPWPEEGNRKLTAAIAKWHFAPTATARDNLLAEGIADHSVLVTGNTVIDALYLLLKQIEQNPDMQRELRATFPFLTPARKVILVTAHRRESFGSEFDNICQALKTVVTDSGGIQEEAPSLGKPVLVMRDTTERPEAVKAGTVQLVGNKKDSIVAGIEALLNDNQLYAAMTQAHNPYGDGQSSQRICDFMVSEYCYTK